MILQFNLSWYQALHLYFGSIMFLLVLGTTIITKLRIFVPDAADNVHGSNIFMWSKICAYFVEENGWTRKAILLHMKYFACFVEQNFPTRQINLLHIVCSNIIYAVLTLNPFRCDRSTLFCVKFILPQFTHFCVEKN